MKKVLLILAVALTGVLAFAAIKWYSKHIDADVSETQMEQPVQNSDNSDNPTSSKIDWNVMQVAFSKWNTPKGIPYIQVPGANLGAISFDILDLQRVAFLSNATNEVIIVDRSNGEATQKFPVVTSPKDFIYDSGFFYVLSENSISIYDTEGKSINQFNIPAKYLGVERLTRYASSTYLLLPSGNSLKIESNGKSVTEEVKGWATQNGDFVFTRLSGDNTYSINLTRGSESWSHDFTTDKKVAGVFVGGSSPTRLILDVQTFISENPIVVERHFVAIELTSQGIENTIVDIKAPDVYYVLSNKEIYMTKSGEVFNMVSAPTGLYVFSLVEKAGTVNGYPVSLNEKYHFNEHLVKVD